MPLIMLFWLMFSVHLPSSAQDTVTVIAWNLLNIYSSSTDRVPNYPTVTDSSLADIITVQEVHGLGAAKTFRAGLS